MNNLIIVIFYIFNYNCVYVDTFIKIKEGVFPEDNENLKVI